MKLVSSEQGSKSLLVDDLFVDGFFHQPIEVYPELNQAVFHGMREGFGFHCSVS